MLNPLNGPRIPNAKEFKEGLITGEWKDYWEYYGMFNKDEIAAGAFARKNIIKLQVEFYEALADLIAPEQIKKRLKKIIKKIKIDNNFIHECKNLYKEYKRIFKYINKQVILKLNLTNKEVARVVRGNPSSGKTKLMQIFSEIFIVTSLDKRIGNFDTKVINPHRTELIVFNEPCWSKFILGEHNGTGLKITEGEGYPLS